MANIEFKKHDHAGCITSALATAEELCQSRKLQFTPIRRRVLEILLAEHRALGAYEILDVLAQEGVSAQPPVAYRALDFLTRHGLAHRIEQLNAYAACAHAGQEHVPAFLICRGCKAVAESEIGLAQGHLGEAASRTGFVIERVVVEAEGLCPHCATGPTP